MVALRPILLTLLVVLPAFGQVDQQTRKPTRDDRGLLRINEDYFNLAAMTGGDFYFWAAGEFAASAPVDVPMEREDVALEYGSLDKSTHSIEIPIEANVRSLSVFCGAQRLDLIVLVRPDGTIVRHEPPAARLQSFQHMTIITIDSPVAGSWKLEITGEGRYATSVRVRPGTGAPSLDRFDFVEERGRPGHEGLFEINRPLRKGESIDCAADVSEGSDVVFSFVAIDGRSLGGCNLERIGNAFAGRCEVPMVPFRVAVEGTDSSSLPFRRTHSRAHTPK